MRIALHESFQRDARALPEDVRRQMVDALLALPAAFREPQRHTGLGLRKVHAKGIREVRLGLGLRVLLLLTADEALLLRICSHEEVRRFLHSL